MGFHAVNEKPGGRAFHILSFTCGSQGGEEDKEGEGKKGKEAGEGEGEEGEREGKWWIIRRKSPPARGAGRGGKGDGEEWRRQEGQRREKKEEGEGGISNDR